MNKELEEAIKKGEVLAIGEKKKEEENFDLDNALSTAKNLKLELDINDPIGIDFQKVFPPSIYLTVHEILSDLIILKGLKKEIRFELQEISAIFQENRWEKLFNEIEKFLNSHDEKGKLHFKPEIALCFLIHNQIHMMQRNNEFSDFISQIRNQSQIINHDDIPQQEENSVEAFLIHFQRLTQNPTTDAPGFLGNAKLLQVRTLIWLLYQKTQKIERDILTNLLNCVEKGDFDKSLQELNQIFELIISKEEISGKFPSLDKELENNDLNNRVLAILWFVWDILRENEPLNQNTSD